MSYELERFFSLVPDLLSVISGKGRFLEVNSSFEQKLGWPPQELRSKAFLEFIHPDDGENTSAQIHKLKSRPGSFRSRFRCSDGSYRSLRWHWYPGKRQGLIHSVAREITEEDETDNLFRTVIEASPVAIVMADNQGKIVLCNAQAEGLFGYEPGELAGQPVEVLLPDRFRSRHETLRDGFTETFQSRPMGANRDLLGRHKDATEFPVEVGLRTIRTTRGVWVLSAILDLTRRKRAEQEILSLATELEATNKKLAELAVTDELTGLKNRRAFLEQFDRDLHTFQRLAGTISLLLLDVDHFKAFNDEFGHSAGDEGLRQTAQALLSSLRHSDFVARYGGEEFAVILPNTDAEGSAGWGDRFRDTLAGVPWPNRPLTVSIGATTYRWSSQGTSKVLGLADSLIQEADRALYHSKKNGRDRLTHVREIG